MLIGVLQVTMQDTGMLMAGAIIMVLTVDIQQGQEQVIIMVPAPKLLILHLQIPGPPIAVLTCTGIVKPV